MEQARYWAVVPAAGIGKRMQADRPKQYLELAGRPVIAHTLARLAAHPRIAGVVVALSPEDPYWAASAPLLDKPLLTVDGGAERCHSVLNGLERLTELAAPADWVLVHDAARPCLRREDIDRLLDAVGEDDGGGLLGLPLSDTVKRSDAAGHVTATVERAGLWRALTPQLFRHEHLHRALRQAIDGRRLVTDESSAMEMAGYRPRMVEGHADNIKITQPGDLALASLYLREQADAAAAR